MGRYFLLALLSTVIFSWPSAGVAADPPPGTQSALSQNPAPDPDSVLPPAPRGKSTVLGGAIQQVDQVRDQLTLKIAGGGRTTTKVLYDERTQVYRDGVRIHLRDLRPEEHASVETVLDGTNVFALSIHVLSQTPEGDAQGQVLSYNPENGELIVNDSLSGQAIGFSVPAGTPVVRVGEGAFSSAGSGRSDLVKGALVSIKFAPGNGGRGTATHIDIRATPGAAFVFSGDVTFLDVPSGRLTIVDPRDQRTYQVSFDPGRVAAVRDLHQGSHVMVTANFDGTRYVASTITTN